MNLPFEYDQRRRRRVRRHDADHHRLRARPRRHPAGAARTHHVVRARHAQRSARDPRRVVAHGAVGRGDRDRRPQHRHLHAAGDGVPVRDDGRGDARRSGASPPRSSTRDKFPVVLGGEHSITSPVVAAVAAKYPGLSVLQIDAHADLRDIVHGHAAQPRVRDAPRARVRARRRRSASAACRPKRRRPRRRCRPTIFYDFNMRAGRATGSIASSTRSARRSTSRSTCDGLDPAIMPATGTPEPGGLTLVRDAGAAARASSSRARVVGCDIVELSPMPGNVAPNFLCAKLIYKILSYRFGAEVRRAEERRSTALSVFLSVVELRAARRR